MTSTLKWTIGSAHITAVVETQAGSVIQSIIPDATPTNIRAIPWLSPSFADTDGQLLAVVQTFLVEIDGKRILVDTCVGNGKRRLELAAWNDLQTDFLSRLSEHGFTRENVDMVICTHLHFDHVGWNTIRDGSSWVPTFPNAVHVFCEDEFRYWSAEPQNEIEDDRLGFADSVAPIVKAGLARLVPAEAVVTEGVSLISTPGHTPHHASVLIRSDGSEAIISGDALHHPCQIEHPEWGTESDSHRELAELSRRKLLGYAAETGALLLGSHFAAPVACRIKRVAEERFRAEF